MNLYNEQYLIDNLAQAVMQARAALAFDQQGQYDAAYEAYRRALSLMQAQYNMVPQQYQPALQANVRFSDHGMVCSSFLFRCKSTRPVATLSLHGPTQAIPHSEHLWPLTPMPCESAYRSNTSLLYTPT